VTMMERIEKMRVSDDALDLVFRKARTYNTWLPKPVPEELLRQLYDTLKWGPTSANISPARFSDKPLVVRVPKDRRVQLRVACRKRDKRRQSGRPGQ